MREASLCIAGFVVLVRAVFLTVVLGPLASACCVPVGGPCPQSLAGLARLVAASSCELLAMCGPLAPAAAGVLAAPEAAASGGGGSGGGGGESESESACRENSLGGGGDGPAAVSVALAAAAGGGGAKASVVSRAEESRMLRLGQVAKCRLFSRLFCIHDMLVYDFCTFSCPFPPCHPVIALCPHSLQSG